MRRSFLTGLALLALAPPAPGAEAFRYPEKKHGKGELKYVNGVPVLVLAGTPEEMGEQMGVLGVRPLAGATKLLNEFLKQHRLDKLRPLLVKFGERILKSYPEAYRREFEAIAKASGVDREVGLLANTFGDLMHLSGCANLMIAPAQSKTGGALMGRNWDMGLPAGAHAYLMVIVYRPQGKRAFAVVGFPGGVAGTCLMGAANADGLALGGNSIYQSADGSPALELKNTSTGVLARRVLEECGTLAEAEKLLRANKPAIRMAFGVCDRSGGGVFELTPKTVALRRSGDGFCYGTNRFDCKGLASAEGFCPRAFVLAQTWRLGKVGVADVAKKMAEVNQGAATASATVWELKPLKLHVAFGDGKKPANDFPLRAIDLSKYLKPD
jgi:hypothetical protein